MSQDIKAGELRFRALLGSEAVYRVLEPGPEHVLVEAVDVPGLGAGFRLRLLTVDVAAMAVVDVRREVEQSLMALLAPPVRRAA